MAVVFLQKTEIGFEPWVTEGTPETTRLLLDTSTGRSDVAGGFFHIGVDAGDTLFFSMTTNDARTIWRTDGTLATTRPVLSDENGNASLYRYGAAVLDDYAITTGFTGGLTGVYSVDAAGNAEALVPTLVDNSDPFRPIIRGPEALDFVSLGDRVVFRASDTDYLVADKYLYGTDGTAAGTEVIGTYSGNFVNLTFDRDAVLGDKLIYLAPADAGRTLHVTDGTAAGTFQLPVPAGIISPDVMVEANGLVFFTTLPVGGGTRPNPYQVWQTDGTAAGTQKVADLADLYPWPDQIAVGTTRGITFSNVASDGEDVAFLTTYRQRENLDRTVYELFTVESGEAISRGTVGSQFPLEPTATRAVTSLVGVTQGTAILFDKAFLVSTLTSVDLDTNIETELLVRDYKVDRVWFVQGEVFSVALLGRFAATSYTVEVVATDGTAAGTETIGETQISRTGELPDNLIHMDGDRVYFLDSGDGYGVMSSDGTADGTVRISELVTFPLWSIIGTVPDLPALVASAAGELLEGDAGANTIAALGGNDTINGLAGNDILSGNTGDDVLNGGLGNDRLDGGLGTDTASYEDATGTVFVFLNAGFSKGADGRDTLQAIENADGSAFADYLWGSAGANVLSGGAGNDRLKGNGGTDQLFGGAGDDILKGDRGTDLLDGGTGADRLLGFAGDDTLLGGSGADFLYGGRDNDQLNGGDGEDVLRGNLGIDVLDGADGADRIYGGGSNDTLIGGAGNDQLFGEGARDRLSGGAGDDVLTGGFGAGVLDGVQDTFVFESSAAGGGGYDRIKDFEDGTDLIDLSAFGFTDFVTDVSTLAQDRTTGLRINFGDGDILFVFDLQKADFDASDVILV